MNELKRATTRAKRFPAASRFPSSAETAASGTDSILNLFCAPVISVPSVLNFIIRENPCKSVATIYFPLNWAARFSRNAVVPSVLSSVAQHTPNKVASR